MSKLLALVALSAALASCATTPDTASAPVLVGTWRQNPAECETAAPVSELIFRVDGRFFVTWMPFETYQDYWGAWGYDAATRMLSLNVENGNYVPPDIVPSGEISVDAHQLTLNTLSLGSPREGARCAAPFRR